MNEQPETPASTPVAAVFQSYPEPARTRLLALRELIFATAASVPEVGRLEETLKWGQPSYLTPETRSGSTLRLGWNPATPDRCQMYVHCQTRLVPTFRDWFADELSFEGNRAVVIPLATPPPDHVLSRCMEATLTYHRWK